MTVMKKTLKLQIRDFVRVLIIIEVIVLVIVAIEHLTCFITSEPFDTVLYFHAGWVMALVHLFINYIFTPAIERIIDLIMNYEKNRN